MDYKSLFRIPIDIDRWYFFSEFFGNKENTKLLVWMRGAPSLWGRMTYKSLLAKGYDVIVSEYIWSLRSDWAFTPSSCIDTIIQTQNYVKSWEFKCIDGKVIHKHYDHISYVWSSFGALFFPYVNWFDSYYLLAPLLDPMVLWGTKYKEQSIDDFAYAMMEIFPYIYRWFDLQRWNEFFSQHANILYNSSFSEKKIHILHGKKDKALHYTRSLDFVKTRSHISITLYPSMGHNSYSLIQKLSKVL